MAVANVLMFLHYSIHTHTHTHRRLFEDLFFCPIKSKKYCKLDKITLHSMSQAILLILETHIAHFYAIFLSPLSSK